jgi:heme oxygenase
MASSERLKKLFASTASVAACREARMAWTRETAAALREAQREMNDRLDAVVMRVSEEEFNRLFDEEQAKVDAFLKPMRAAAEQDKWPRHLHAASL